MKAVRTNKKKSRVKLMHQYYGYTGFYTFVLSSLKKSVLPIILVVVGIMAIDSFLIDFGDLFVEITNTFDPINILAVFFASESLLGLIPPEIFIAWSGKTETPMFYLSMLALLSYLGGVVSYFIGKAILSIPAVYDYLEVKMKRHLVNIRKWGGFLIVVGALLPIPFSITSVAAGLINYKFSNYLKFGLLRFIRFYLYAVVIYNVL